LHGGFGSLEPDFGMLAVAKGFRSRGSAAAQEDPVLAGYIIEVAVAIAQLELAQVSREEIRPVFGRNHFDRHSLLLFSAAHGMCLFWGSSLVDPLHSSKGRAEQQQS
jgi:hypothetical protein